MRWFKYHTTLLQTFFAFSGVEVRLGQPFENHATQFKRRKQNTIPFYVFFSILDDKKP